MTIVVKWLIERGKPEGEEETIWIEHTRENPARKKVWTKNVYAAAQSDTEELAKAFINMNHLKGKARAVQHAFGPKENLHEEL